MAVKHNHLSGSFLFIATLKRCNNCLITGDRGLNLVMKSDIPEALPDLIQSVPARHSDSTENTVPLLYQLNFYTVC